MKYYIMKGKGSTATIIDTEFYTPIDYRPTPVGQQTITGRRAIEGINYVGGGEIKVNRQQALGLGQQNIANLGNIPPYATKSSMNGGTWRNVPQYEKYQVPEHIQKKLSKKLGRLGERHLRGGADEMEGGAMVGSGLFDSIWKKVKKTAKKVAKTVVETAEDVGDFIEDAGEFLSKPDAGKLIGKEIGNMLNIAEKELEKAGKSVIDSAERGTLISDALKLTATAVSKYGPQMAGYIASGIVGSYTGGVGGVIAKQVASTLMKELVDKLKLDAITASAINKVAKEAEQAGYGMSGGNTRTTGRPQPHYSYKSASRLSVPNMPRGLTNRNEISFNSLHPMNYRKASIKDLQAILIHILKRNYTRKMRQKLSMIYIY